MTNAVSSGNRRVRIALLALGGAMWVAVFVVLILKWKHWRETVVESPGGETVPVTVPAFQPYELPAFELLDQNGQRVTKADLAGRYWVASFLFHRCSTHCPRVAAELEKLQSSLNDTPVTIVTITVDPEHDTPEVMKRWAESLAADSSRWKFLTGDPENVYPLLKEGFRITAVPNTGKERTPGNEVTHSQSVLLIDGTGTVISKYNGLSPVELNRLKRDLKSAVENDNKSNITSE